jgi:hypothetical protein
VYTWSAVVAPSFHGSFAFGLTALHAYDEPWESPHLLRLAFMAPDGETGTLTLPEDPVIEALHALDLYEQPQYAVLDGIGYRFSFQAPSTSVSLRMQSPHGSSLVRIEHALLATARRARALSRSDGLAQTLETWAEYLEPGGT